MNLTDIAYMASEPELTRAVDSFLKRKNPSTKQMKFVSDVIANHSTKEELAVRALDLLSVMSIGSFVSIIKPFLKHDGDKLLSLFKHSTPEVSARFNKTLRVFCGYKFVRSSMKDDVLFNMKTVLYENDN